MASLVAYRLFSFLKIDGRFGLEKSMPKACNRADPSRIVTSNVDIPVGLEFIACTGLLLRFFGNLKVLLVWFGFGHKGMSIGQRHIVLWAFLSSV